jgi:haloacetate dehalogenase
MFDGFELDFVDTGEATLRVRRGGGGPPVLLLHGHPQTHVMWHLVAPRLAEDFFVVAADLRGYGESSKPPTTDDHEPYSKRAMARDQVALMRALGHERFAVVGHDRGARCAYRLALDHPERVERLAVLDIVPTADTWRRVDMRAGLEGFWHWFFLAQPYDLPERMLSADPEAYYFHDSRSLFAPEALEDYRRAVRNAETVHAMCEDYRAGASIDFELDEADRGKRRIACPVLALWSAHDEAERFGWDVLAIWREWADDVDGRAIDCGHYLAEEAPDETYEELARFLSPRRSPSRS